QPEAAGREGPFSAVDPIVRAIAVHQSILRERLADALYGRAHPRIGGWQEADARDRQRAGVQRLAPERLGEGAQPPVLAPLQDRGPDLLTDPLPARQGRGELMGLGEPNPAIQRRPAHEPRVEELLLAPADLPDAVVGLLPTLRGLLDEVTEQRPDLWRRAEQSRLVALVSQPVRAVVQLRRVQH